MLSLTHSSFFSQTCTWNLFSWNGNGGVGGLPFSNEEFAGGVFVACARALGNTQVWANLSRSKYATERRKVESSMCRTASCSSPVPSRVEASSQGSTILLPILSLFFFAKEYHESLLQKHMHASLLQKSMHHLSHRRAWISLEEEHVSVHKGFQIQGSSFLQSVIVFVSSFWSEDERICVFLSEIILHIRKPYGSSAIKACSNSDKEVKSPGERESTFLRFLGWQRSVCFEMVLSGAFCCMIKSKSLTSTQRSWDIILRVSGFGLELKLLMCFLVDARRWRPMKWCSRCRASVICKAIHNRLGNTTSGKPMRFLYFM